VQNISDNDLFNRFHRICFGAIVLMLDRVLGITDPANLIRARGMIPVVNQQENWRTYSLVDHEYRLTNYGKIIRSARYSQAYFESNGQRVL